MNAAWAVIKYRKSDAKHVQLTHIYPHSCTLFTHANTHNHYTLLMCTCTQHSPKITYILYKERKHRQTIYVRHMLTQTVISPDLIAHHLSRLVVNGSLVKPWGTFSATNVCITDNITPLHTYTQHRHTDYYTRYKSKALGCHVNSYSYPVDWAICVGQSSG